MYKIREYREEKGLTQAELGRRVGVGQSAVAKWESGINTPELPKAVRLADELTGGDINLLMGRNILLEREILPSKA